MYKCANCFVTLISVIILCVCGCAAKHNQQTKAIVHVKVYPTADSEEDFSSEIANENPPMWFTQCMEANELKPPRFNLLSYPEMNLATLEYKQTRMRFQVPEYEDYELRIDPELWQEMYVGRIFGHLYLAGTAQRPTSDSHLRWMQTGPHSYQSSLIGSFFVKRSGTKSEYSFFDVGDFEETIPYSVYPKLSTLREIEYYGELVEKNARAQPSGNVSFKPKYVELILPGSGPICVQVNS